ncbi:MAG: glycine cleavage system protein GcvH [Luteitalea sp.]|nr:glycine cleavage system protein GcvH [Luteitalea sp.]
MYPADLKYTNDHEWLRSQNDGHAEVGITDYAQQQLGDVVFVELPEVGRAVAQGEAFGTIESVKAVSELFAPVAGEVTAVNTELQQHPEQMNANPHAAWIIKLRIANAAETDTLLSSERYTEMVGEKG